MFFSRFIAVIVIGGVAAVLSGTRWYVGEGRSKCTAQNRETDWSSFLLLRPFCSDFGETNLVVSVAALACCSFLPMDVEISDSFAQRRAW